jgi:hypothetical protein
LLHGSSFAAIAVLPTWRGAAVIYCATVAGVLVAGLLAFVQVGRGLQSVD